MKVVIYRDSMSIEGQVRWTSRRMIILTTQKYLALNSPTITATQYLDVPSLVAFALRMTSAHHEPFQTKPCSKNDV